MGAKPPCQVPSSGAATCPSLITTFEDNRLQAPPDEQLTTNEELFQIGRTTNFTAGKYNGLLRVRLLPNNIKDASGNTTIIEEETYEHVIVGGTETENFSERGDSGATIFDMSCRFVGMLIAGNTATKAITLRRIRLFLKILKGLLVQRRCGFWRSDLSSAMHADVYLKMSVSAYFAWYESHFFGPSSSFNK